MGLVPQGRLVADLQTLLPSSSDFSARSPVAGFEPQGDTILTLTNRYDASANLVSGCIHGFPDNREDSKKPPFVSLSGFGIFFGKSQDEFPSVLVCLVLPSGFFR